MTGVLKTVPVGINIHGPVDPGRRLEINGNWYLVLNIVLCRCGHPETSHGCWDGEAALAKGQGQCKNKCGCTAFWPKGYKLKWEGKSEDTA